MSVDDKQPTSPSPPRARLRNTRDVLGVAWVHGSFSAAVYRRQARIGAWDCSTAVETIEEFSAALTSAVQTLDYGGAEAFLLLAHDEFVQQLESVPPLSESAVRAYLRGRVERFEKAHEPVLWVSQRAATARNEAAHVVHLLSRSFHARLSEVLRAHHLDLTRLAPVLVPLQNELARSGEPAGQAFLLAAEAGSATAVVVGRPNGEVFFTRTTLASWRDEPARVAVEVNRSLLYAKQQFASVIDRIRLLGPSAGSARPEVEAKCGTGKSISVREAGLADWLDIIARLPARHPVNLVSAHLRQKQRQRMLRRVIIAACWLGLALVGLDLWHREQAWQLEQRRLADLRVEEPALQQEKDRLQERNTAADRDRMWLRSVVDDRLPPLPGKLLAYVATLLPREARLSGFAVRWEAEERKWVFRIDGTVEADEETARAAVASLRRLMAAGPLPIQLVANARGAGAVSVGSGTILHRFSIEGGLCED